MPALGVAAWELPRGGTVDAVTAVRGYRWLVILSLAACLAAAGAGWDNSATNDEPYFTFGAYAAAGGRGLWVVEHPPLYKLAAGLALSLLDLNPVEVDPGGPPGALPRAIHLFLHENRVPALTILRTARLGMLLFLPLFLWGVYRLGEVLAGPNVGLAAAVAAACQPLVLGHAFVVHTDVPAAACWVWACVFCERFLSGRRRAWVGLGVWVGLALAAKHSGVLLVLLLAVRVLAARLQRSDFGTTPLLGAGLLACVVPWMLTELTLRQVPAEQEAALVRLVTAQFPSWPWVGQLLEPLSSVCKACCHWLLGFAYVMWNSTQGQGINFFFGETSPHGFALYFPVALLAKLSLPFTVLWVVSLGRWRSLPSGFRWLAGYVALYLVAGLGTAFNIGARHLMPAVGWLAVLAGWSLARWRGFLRSAVLVALAVSPVVAFPHYISHFSLLVGGTRGGERVLHDSNLDWGQDWARLAKVARRQGWQPLYAVYLGPDDPGGYGVPVENLLITGKIPESGYVAVSSWAATVGPAYYGYFGLAENRRYLLGLLAHLRGCAPVAQVGHTIRVVFCGAQRGSLGSSPPGTSGLGAPVHDGGAGRS